ncbi:hypothetical protein ACG7TL_005406 [Trametes sanguinea]
MPVPCLSAGISHRALLPAIPAIHILPRHLPQPPLSPAAAALCAAAVLIFASLSAPAKEVATSSTRHVAHVGLVLSTPSPSFAALTLLLRPCAVVTLVAHTTYAAPDALHTHITHTTLAAHIAGVTHIVCAAKVVNVAKACLSFEERDLLQQMEIDPLDDGLDLDDGCLPPLPPGEEGMFFSHAGSDAELFNELFTGDTKSKRVDAHTHRNRTLVRTQEWEIQRDLAVNVALHHDTPDWQVLNRCPPCMNKLENQAVLSPSMLVMMVGNQSLKLIDSMFRSGTILEDTHTAWSEIWISPEKVDCFKDEVKAQKAIKQFFGFWSKQKHAESGKFILHNYQQALDTIKTDTETLDLLCQQLGVGPAHFKRFLQEERTYFKSCKSEPPEVTAELDYMDSLVGLQVAGLSAIAAKAATEKLDTFIHLYVNNPQATKKKQQQVSSVRTKDAAFASNECRAKAKAIAYFASGAPDDGQHDYADKLYPLHRSFQHGFTEEQKHIWSDACQDYLDVIMDLATTWDRFTTGLTWMFHSDATRHPNAPIEPTEATVHEKAPATGALPLQSLFGNNGDPYAETDMLELLNHSFESFDYINQIHALETTIRQLQVNSFNQEQELQCLREEVVGLLNENSKLKEENVMLVPKIFGSRLATIAKPVQQAARPPILHDPSTPLNDASDVDVPPRGRQHPIAPTPAVANPTAIVCSVTMELGVPFHIVHQPTSPSRHHRITPFGGRWEMEENVLDNEWPAAVRLLLGTPDDKVIAAVVQAMMMDSIR